MNDPNSEIGQVPPNNTSALFNQSVYFFIKKKKKNKKDGWGEEKGLIHSTPPKCLTHYMILGRDPFGIGVQHRQEKRGKRRGR